MTHLFVLSYTLWRFYFVEECNSPVKFNFFDLPVPNLITVHLLILEIKLANIDTKVLRWEP